MLVVLSEINCLGRLKSLGVYPDEFYTDFTLFKNKAFGFNDADIIIIIAGSCQFNKHIVIEETKNLLKRVNNEQDKGIKSVSVVTDVNIPNLKQYFKFTGDIVPLTEFSGWKNKGVVEFWDNFKGEKKFAETYLSEFDQGLTTDIKEMYKDTVLKTREDKYLDIIYRPDLSAFKFPPRTPEEIEKARLEHLSRTSKKEVVNL